MPVIVQTSPHQRQLGRRPAPQIIINVRRHRLRTAHFAYARPPLVTETARDQDFTQVPALDPADGLGDAVAGTALGSGLDDALVLAGGFDSFAPFPDVVGNRLFDIDIFT